jgi:lipopolysaccharide export LptBFGC system permease protein LptF
VHPPRSRPRHTNRLKLHLHVLYELLLGLAFTLGGVLVLALPATAAVAVKSLPGVEIQLVLLYVPLVLAGLLPYVMPLAFLLTVVSTYGRLAADNEWTAIRMSGRNPLELFAPGVALALVLGVFTLWMASEKLPDIRSRQSSFLTSALAEQVKHFSPGRTEVRLGDFYLSAAARDGDEFLSAYIYLPPQKGEDAKKLIAERVRFEADEHSVYAHFKNARSVVGGQDLRSGAPVFRIDLDVLLGKSNVNTGVRYMTSRMIKTKLESGALDRATEELLRYEIQYRRALASTYFIFLLLGASTALIMRGGTQLGALAVAVGYALLYYVLSMRLGKILLGAHLIAPGSAAWTVIVIGLVAGSALTWKAMRE